MVPPVLMAVALMVAIMVAHLRRTVGEGILGTVGEGILGTVEEGIPGMVEEGTPDMVDMEWVVVVMAMVTVVTVIDMVRNYGASHSKMLIQEM